MKVTLTIQKGKNGILWGYCNHENNLLVEHGFSVDQLKEKIKFLLQGFYQLHPAAIDFAIETPALKKAKHLVLRLSRKHKAPEIIMEWNDHYFS